MKAYVITIRGHEYSERSADRCIKSAAEYGVEVEKFDAVGKDTARALMEAKGLEWTWPSLGAQTCPRTGLKQYPYATKEPAARIGCALSHLELWERCVASGDPILILEHDAVFVSRVLESVLLPPADWSAIMVNDPVGATPRGFLWSKWVQLKGPGIHTKTEVFTDGRPDGLAGHSAYIISPRGAARCLQLVHENGLWPNDATMCRQLVPGLYELYPFLTEVRQTQSTSGGY